MCMTKLAAAATALAASMHLSPLLAQPSAPSTQAEPPPAIVEIYTGEDAAAVLEARLVALRTVIGLTPEQQKHWAPVEAAIRQVARNAAERRAQQANAAMPVSFVDLIDRAADAEIARAIDMKAVTVVLRPLVVSLSETQRRRIPAFLGLREGHSGQAQPLAELWLFEDEQ